MIAEGIEYIMTPCQPWSRRAGFLYQMIALRARYRRNKVAWKNHIEACHNFVIKVAEMTKNKNRAIVLGSGLLIETPIDYLANRFHEVILVDAIHGLPERWKVRQYQNVTMIEADITGLINTNTINIRKDFDITQMSKNFDLAISSNVLSQLPLFLHNSLNSTLLSNEDAATERQVIVSHISNIRMMADRYCLISDYEHYIIDDELRAEHVDLFCGVMLPPPSETWTWSIALRPEVFRNKDVYSHVGAWSNLDDM